MRPLLCFLGLLATAVGQPRVTQHNLHGWWTYEGDHPIGGSRWSLHFDGHWRRHDFVRSWQQLLLRPGIIYNLNSHWSVAAGYAYVDTWSYGPSDAGVKFREYRLWEQAAVKWKTGKVSWGSRFRFENRFIRAAPNDYRFEDRLRLMQRFTVPVRAKTYFTAYDEYWVYVRPYSSNSWFDQNRAYAGIGWNLSKHWKFETGYMHQAILRRTGLVLESNHTIRFTLVSAMPIGRR